MGMTIRYNKTSEAQPSPGLWGRCTLDEEPNRWIHLFEDFVSFDQSADLGGTFSFINTGSGTAALQTDEVGGVVRITNQDTDNDEVTLVTGDDTAGFCKFQNGKEIFFEARIAPSSITNTELGWFAGLGEESLGGALFSTGDIMEAKDLVGWRVLTADADQVEPVYNTDSGTEVVVKADAQTLVAGTFYKLGLWFDGEYCHWFINGVDITGADVSYPVDYSTSNFPDGEEMAAYVGIASAGGGAYYLDVDWIRVAAERD